MPQRKGLPALPDIEGIGRNPGNMLVQKSNPLLSLSKTSLTLADFKILDTYLGRIDSHKPEERFVRMEKGEIEKLLGVSQIKPQDLEKRIDNLFQTVTIRDRTKRNGVIKIALFEKAECYQDEDGLWVIDLGASYSAMEYIFNPENLGYLRYRLSNVVNLTSRYSYILFLYLEQNRHMHLVWEVQLDDLKKQLKCTAASYESYKEFNDKILKKCHKELNEKTTCHFAYEAIRRGRSVKAVRFVLEPLPASVQRSEQVPLSDPKSSVPNESPALPTSQADLWGGLTKDQIDALRLIAGPLAKGPTSIDTVIQQHIAIAKTYRAKNMFAYVKKAISEAAFTEIRKTEDVDARRQEDAQRAKEDLARAMRILAQMDEDGA